MNQHLLVLLLFSVGLFFSLSWNLPCSCSLFHVHGFLSPQQWILSGFRGPEPGFRSLLSFQQTPTYLFPAASAYLWSRLGDLSVGLLLCGAEHFDQTLVRLLWTLSWTKPHHWPAEPSLARIPPPLISNQVPLSDFPTTDSLILPTGYKSPAVFAIFRVELSSTLKSLSPTAVARIKSVLLF